MRELSRSTAAWSHRALQFDVLPGNWWGFDGRIDRVGGQVNCWIIIFKLLWIFWKVLRPIYDVLRAPKGILEASNAH